MQSMQGEAGCTGNPSRLPAEGLADYGVRGRGEFRISERDGSSGETLEWLPEAPPESSNLGGDDLYRGLSWPPKGGLGAETLGVRTGSPIESVYNAPREESERLAGPVQFIVKLLECWRLEADHAVGLLGFDPSDADHVTGVLAGREQFRGRDVRDRIAHLYRIRKTLWSLFRDLDTENEWLREPHSLLDDRSPLSLVVGGSMEDLLLAREYVDAAAGR